MIAAEKLKDLFRKALVLGNALVAVTPTPLDDAILAYVEDFFHDEAAPPVMHATADPTAAKPKHRILRGMIARRVAHDKGISFSQALARVNEKYPDDAALMVVCQQAAVQVDGLPPNAVGQLGDGSIMKLILEHLSDIAAFIGKIVAIILPLLAL